MSHFVYHEVVCDGPGEPSEPCCYATFSDLGTLIQVRAKASAAGWLTAAGTRHRDYCPSCRKDATTNGITR